MKRDQMLNVDMDAIKKNVTIEREKRLEKIIYELVKKVRLYHGKYNNEYLGGRPFQYVIREIEELGIDIEDK